MKIINSYSGKKKNIDYSGRGMSFEKIINFSNDYYRIKKIAVIYKKPTPINIVKVNYPKRSAAKITEAYFKQSSTTDYNGVYKGKYVDFDAKETINKTSFPLKNFHDHQIKHLQSITESGGIGFSIISFTSLNKYFILPSKYLFEAWGNKDNKKSIPLSVFEKYGIEIFNKINPQLDYLKGVDLLIKDQYE